MPHCLKILTKIISFVKKHFWLYSFAFLITSLAFSSGIIIGANILSRPPMIIEKELILNLEESLAEVEAKNESLKEFSYVASSRGKYYYPIDCSLAKNLKEENKIYFKTKEEAEDKGYIYNTKCD
ncbi:MAG: hypothetical protein PHT66_00375 [Candidatus Pacebacteria bacterium]|jgi:hypothetical protein|nr:hypothetical protein [Candidatus Paceibacterota bacterium]MDD5535159.1 hypothetical protein [Candidatus Paceibacterota bacterium]